MNGGQEPRLFGGEDAVSCWGHVEHRDDGALVQRGMLGTKFPLPPGCQLTSRKVRTEFGRPAASMRFRTTAPTATSVQRPASFLARSRVPMTALQRPIVVSTSARLPQPVTSCQPSLPSADTVWIWTSRREAFVPISFGGVELARGGITTSMFASRAAMVA